MTALSPQSERQSRSAIEVFPVPGGPTSRQEQEEDRRVWRDLRAERR